jgi:hypothetical protein
MEAKWDTQGHGRLQVFQVLTSNLFGMSGLGGGLGRTRICDLYRVNVADALTYSNSH